MPHFKLVCCHKVHMQKGIVMGKYCLMVGRKESNNINRFVFDFIMFLAFMGFIR